LSEKQMNRDDSMTQDLSPVLDRNIRSAEIIQLDPFDPRRAFSPRELIQATLPHKNPGDVPIWSRKNGNYILTVQPGQSQGKLLGYPYGTIPRLLMCWLTTEALKTGNRRLELGDSLASFMRKLGLDSTRGGKRSDAQRLRDQMNRLFRARISFDYTDGQRDRWLDMQIAPEGEVWWSDVFPEDRTLMGSWIELGEHFFNAIWKHPVPVDLRAIDALKNSALALDLYTWATYRTYRAEQRQEAQSIPWPALAAQFGAEYERHRDFKRKAQQQLKRIQQVFPTLRLDEKDNCLIIKPSSPAVKHQSAKRTIKPVKKSS
jgi:Plasmid encoded RepA protein